MNDKTLINILICVFCFIAIIRIGSFFNISMSTYGVYLGMYIFLALIVFCFGRYE